MDTFFLIIFIVCICVITIGKIISKDTKSSDLPIVSDKPKTISIEYSAPHPEDCSIDDITALLTRYYYPEITQSYLEYLNKNDKTPVEFIKYVEYWLGNQKEGMSCLTNKAISNALWESVRAQSNEFTSEADLFNDAYKYVYYDDYWGSSKVIINEELLRGMQVSTTGKFKSPSDLYDIIEQCGAERIPLSLKTDILVLGRDPAITYTHKAMNWNSKGYHIEIMKIKKFISFLDETEKNLH